jgi:hypothetical protein
MENPVEKEIEYLKERVKRLEKILFQRKISEYRRKKIKDDFWLL